jgi:hypothetical protein
MYDQLDVMIKLNQDKLAPILLFAYRRTGTIKKVVVALQQNYLAKDSELYVFSDAAKEERDLGPVQEVRAYLKLIDGFKRVTICEAATNSGLAASVIRGVTEIISKHGKVIVLEDDLITSINFLSYMNQALDYYEHDAKAFSIAGYSKPISGFYNQDVYFTQRASSWGWGTWIDRWNKVDWFAGNDQSFKKDMKFKTAFNKMGSDLSKMLDDQIAGRINSWAIKWVYNQFLNRQFTVYPTVSKIMNIGTAEGATHTRDSFGRFKTILDESKKTDFLFPDDIKLDDFFLRQFLKQYSIATRVKYKLLNSLNP